MSDLDQAWWVSTSGEVMSGLHTHITRRVSGSTPEDAKRNARAIALLPSLLAAMSGDTIKAQIIRCQILGTTSKGLLEQINASNYKPTLAERKFLQEVQVHD